MTLTSYPSSLRMPRRWQQHHNLLLRISRCFSSLSSSSSLTSEEGEWKLLQEYANQPQTQVSIQSLLDNTTHAYSERVNHIHHNTSMKSSDRNHRQIIDRTRQRSLFHNNKGRSAAQLLERGNEEDGLIECDIPLQDDKNASLIQFASFLHRELPVRLAHRIADLENVPHLSDMSSVVKVKKCYIDSFRAITNHQAIETVEDEAAFASQLEQLYQKHSGVLVNMARGAFELRKEQQHDFSVIVNDDIHGFLDRFHTCRIGIRVLAGQYLALRQKQMSESYVGMINKRTSPYEVVQQAIDDATFMCARKYGDAPDVVVRGRLDLTFPYIPTHLHYILLELLKNSMRATMDWHGAAVSTQVPPIQVVIADGKENEDVSIKVTDEGGGIPRSNMKRIWNYLFTTADSNIQEAFNAATNVHIDHSIDSPLAGLGYGLPISRSYARYFGGDLGMMSMEGFGTDAFVHLARLGNDASDETRARVIV